MPDPDPNLNGEAPPTEPPTLKQFKRSEVKYHDFETGWYRFKTPASPNVYIAYIILREYVERTYVIDRVSGTSIDPNVSICAGDAQGKRKMKPTEVDAMALPFEDVRMWQKVFLIPPFGDSDTQPLPSTWQVPAYRVDKDYANGTVTVTMNWNKPWLEWSFGGNQHG